MTDAPTAPRPTDEERAALLAAYDAQLRGDAEVQGAVSWDRSGPLWRALFSDGGFVSYEIARGRRRRRRPDRRDRRRTSPAIPQVEEFEWKTRGHDWPPDLDERLRAHGLEPDEVETVMVGEASHLAVDVELPDGVTVRRVDQLPEREAVVTEASDMQREVFGGGPSGEEVLDRLDRMDGLEQFWVAEAGRAGRHRAGPARPGRGHRVRRALGRGDAARVARPAASTARSPPPVRAPPWRRASATSTATAPRCPARSWSARGWSR